MEIQAEEEQAFLLRQQTLLMGSKDPTRSPTTRNQASIGPVMQVKFTSILAFYPCVVIAQCML